MRSDARKRLTLADLGRAAGHRTDPPALVGLIGKKRSGKDSFAATLVDEFGFERWAFADPLKEALLTLNPIVFSNGYAKRLQDVVRRCGWEIAKDENREIRRLLQVFGTDSIRSIQEDFWVRATLDPALSSTRPVVFTDCRFPNEAEEIRRAGGKVVRILRPGLESKDDHASETALDDFEADFEVLNSEDLETLAQIARNVVPFLLK